MADYDVIVAGLGAMGSAAAYHLAKRGQRVLGLDAHARGHTLGSSLGETRIIRMAYFEDPNYVPLLRRAYELWDALERDTQSRLLYLTGGLFLGPPDSSLVSGSLTSAQTHGLPHEVLDAGAIRRRFPQFQPRDHEMGLYEEGAGVLVPELCIEAHLGLARAAGAELRHTDAVTDWSADQDGVVVHSSSGRHTAGTLIVTAGPWAGKLLSDVDLPLQPERIPVFWLEPVRHHARFGVGQMPIWIWQDPQLGHFFGTPHLAWPGVKVGKHHSGESVDPDTLNRDVTDDDERPLRQFLERLLPDLAGPVASSRVCLYTNTPDENFIVDRHPRYADVVIAAGFSGHGFKFAGVIGEILADLATGGQATPHADFLKLRTSRFSDPRTQAGAAR